MSSFEFDFFDGPQVAQHQDSNLQQILNKMDHSIDFDQFDPVNHDQGQKSKGSQSFSKNSQRKQSNRMQSAKSREDSHEFQFQNSRNISEISIAENMRNQSFKFESKDQVGKNYLDSNDHRYQKLQALFSRAKTNNLDHFYRNLDQQNTYRIQQKFRNKEEFKDYRNKLKIYKKSLQEDFLQKKGNYNFKYNQYSQPNNKKSSSPQNIYGKQNNFFQFSQPSAPYNFKKKQSSKNETNPKPSQNQPINFFDSQPNNGNSSNNFLPENLHQAQDQVEFYELKPEDINKQIQLYQQKQYQKQAENFFINNDYKKTKQQKSMKKLQTINQQRPNMFEITQEQQKMKKLIVNYQEIKTDFKSLMQNLKETNNDQEQIINEFKEFKKEYQMKESRLKYQEENKREKMIVKEREKQQKNRKINEIKEEIHKIKDNGQKDILIIKLNEKVQNLEQILKNAILQLNQQKQQKLIPKIINYYNQPEVKHTSRSKSRRSDHMEFSNNQNEREESRQQNSGIDRLNDQYLRPVRNAIKDLRQDKQEEGNFIDQFSSPLQLDLTAQDYPLNHSRGRSQQLQPAFDPPQNGKEYHPNMLDTNNKFLRKCLTQKSSIIFQSFEFYVTGKFTITGNERFPVTCQVRVANKCAINLYDIFVIVYGPHAQESELEMRPSKILYDQFRYNTSFIFQVDLAKQILQCGNFSIQISYKTDTITKKKVNFKCVLPFTQLIKPEFIYQQQFINAWNHMGVQYYTKPKQLDFRNIRSHEDLKLILPFIEVNQPDPNSFSYGIMFNYPKSITVFMVKVTCYVSGKASLHLKSGDNNNNSDKKLREQIMDILAYLIFG